jgi:uncharacterized protein YkwD
MPARRSIVISVLSCLFVPAAVGSLAAQEAPGQPSSTPAKTRQSANLTEVVKLIVAKTNEFRKKQGRAAVKTNPLLTETVREFAAFMARTDKFSHKADGKEPSDRARQHKYSYCVIAENIAYEYSSEGFAAADLAARFVEGWKKSPGHRKNMLDPDVTETGVAVAQSEKSGKFYAVAMFGRPRSAAIEFSIKNETDAEVKYKIGDETLALPASSIRTHEQCQSAEVKFEWSEAEGQPQTLKPGPGDRYVVTKKGGKLIVRKEDRADDQPARPEQQEKSISPD